MNLNFSSNRNFFILANLVLTLAIILVGYLVVLPKIKEITSISEAVRQQKLELEKKYQKGQNLKKAYENLELVKNNQQQILASVIEQGEELEFITALEESANGKNVKQNIELSPPNPQGKKTQKLTIQMSLEGNYINILRTLNEMERLKYYVLWQQLIFNGKQTTANPQNTSFEVATGNTSGVLVNLIGEVYWLKP